MSLNIELLKEGFKEATEHNNKFVEVFYEKLFTQYPETRRLFPEDMNSQREKLILSLATIAGALELPHILGPYLEQLGQSHKQFQVVPEHYPVLGQVLLETLAEFLGPKWSPEMQAAWIDAYALISATMLRGYSL